MIRLFVFVALLPITAHAVEPVNRYLLTDVRVTDGDTVTADVQLGYGVTLDDERIRFTGFDAWEASYSRRSVTVTPAEIERGKAATAYLRDLARGGRLYLTPGREYRDHYGRLLGAAIVVQDGRVARLEDLMRQGGHCRD